MPKRVFNETQRSWLESKFPSFQAAQASGTIDSKWRPKLWEEFFGHIDDKVNPSTEPNHTPEQLTEYAEYTEARKAVSPIQIFLA
jgi:hypothetical protein